MVRRVRHFERDAAANVLDEIRLGPQHPGPDAADRVFQVGRAILRRGFRGELFRQVFRSVDGKRRGLDIPIARLGRNPVLDRKSVV